MLFPHVFSATFEVVKFGNYIVNLLIFRSFLWFILEILICGSEKNVQYVSEVLVQGREVIARSRIACLSR